LKDAEPSEEKPRSPVYHTLKDHAKRLDFNINGVYCLTYMMANRRYFLVINETNKKYKVGLILYSLSNFIMGGSQPCLQIGSPYLLADHEESDYDEDESSEENDSGEDNEEEKTHTVQFERVLKPNEERLFHIIQKDRA
jgi:hypothetical protein